MFENQDLATTTDLKRTFSKKDSTNWSYKLYKNTEVLKNAIPNYRIDNLPERYNEALLKKTHLTIKEINSVLEKLIEITKKSQNVLVDHCLYLLIYSLVLKQTRLYYQEQLNQI